MQLKPMKKVLAEFGSIVVVGALTCFALNEQCSLIYEFIHYELEVGHKRQACSG